MTIGPEVRNAKKLVSIVAPFYNEGASIEEFYRRLEAICSDLLPIYRFEFLFIDDGSQDDTLVRLKQIASRDARLRVIEFTRNFGQTPALRAGLDHAQGEIVITMDSDLQHFPEEIPFFLKKIEEGYDMVCGWRKDRKEGILRRWPSQTANWMLRKLMKINVHDFGTTFRAYRRHLIAEMHLFGEMHRFIPALAGAVGARIFEIPIQNISRPSGKSNYGLGRILGVFLDILFLKFYLQYSTKPLRLFGSLALVFMGIGVLIDSILMILFFLGYIDHLRGHMALLLLSILLIILGAILFALGLLSEMINRIYFASHGKPIYHIRDIHYGGKQSESSD